MVDRLSILAQMDMLKHASIDTLSTNPTPLDNDDDAHKMLRLKLIYELSAPLIRGTAKILGHGEGCKFTYRASSSNSLSLDPIFSSDPLEFYLSYFSKVQCQYVTSLHNYNPI